MFVQLLGKSDRGICQLRFADSYSDSYSHGYCNSNHDPADRDADRSDANTDNHADNYSNPNDRAPDSYRDANSDGDSYDDSDSPTIRGVGCLHLQRAGDGNDPRRWQSGVHLHYVEQHASRVL